MSNLTSAAVPQGFVLKEARHEANCLTCFRAAADAVEKILIEGEDATWAEVRYHDAKGITTHSAYVRKSPDD